MGLTAEAVAKEYKVSREDQDEFSFHSHQKAINAIKRVFSNLEFFRSMSKRYIWMKKERNKKKLYSGYRRGTKSGYVLKLLQS